MKKVIVLFGVIACSYCANWDLMGSHGINGEIILGEISVDHHDVGTLSIGKGIADHSSNFMEDHSTFLNEVGASSFHSGHIIPVISHIGIPTIKKIPLSIPHPVIQTFIQPYPVAVVIPKPVPYEVEKPVFKTVEKKVPTPVEKIIPIKIEKLVPFQVVKHVPIPVEKPIPIKIPVYKTVIHKVKGHQ